VEALRERRATPRIQTTPVRSQRPRSDDGETHSLCAEYSVRVIRIHADTRTDSYRRPVAAATSAARFDPVPVAAQRSSAVGPVGGRPRLGGVGYTCPLAAWCATTAIQLLKVDWQQQLAVTCLEHVLCVSALGMFHGAQRSGNRFDYVTTTARGRLSSSSTSSSR